MEKLPVEVVEEICRFLTAKDIISCSSVSRDWRFAFNQNAVWRPHCRQYLEECLRTTPCRVQPKFQSPEDDETTLSPICHWRLAYMRQLTLLRNWRTGNYQTHVLPEDDRDVNAHQLENYAWHYAFDFFKEHCLVKIFKERIEIWDLKTNEPIKISETLLELPDWKHYCFVRSNLDLILLINATHVQVYKMANSSMSFDLRQLFYFDKSLKPSSNTTELLTKDLLQDKHPSDRSSIASAGKFFFGVSVPAKGNSVLHVWNMESGLKIKEETSPKKNGWRILGIEGTEFHEDIIITCGAYSEHQNIVRPEPNEELFYCIYSSSRLDYYPFMKTKITNRAIGVLNKNYFLCYDGKDVTIYNYKTSEEISSISVSALTIDVIDYGFLVMDDVEILHIFGISNLTWDTHMFENIMWVQPLSGNFVRMQLKIPEVATFIWELGSRKKITSFCLPKFSDFTMSNRSGTRILVKEGFCGGYVLSVRYFW